VLTGDNIQMTDYKNYIFGFLCGAIPLALAALLQLILN
jgi:hypothetical protein